MAPVRLVTTNWISGLAPSNAYKVATETIAFGHRNTSRGNDPFRWMRVEE